LITRRIFYIFTGMTPILKSLPFIILLYSPSFAQTGFQRTYGTDPASGHAVLQVAGGYLLAGEISTAPSDQNAVIIKTDSIGNPVWVMEYGGAFNEQATAVCPTSDGGFVATGMTMSYVGPSLSDQANVFLFKIDSLGNTLWSRSINHGIIDGAHSVSETADHGFILCGYTGTMAVDRDLLLIKTDSVGTTQWIRVFGTASQSYDIGHKAIEMRSGGYAIAGYSTAFTGPNDTSAYVIITNTIGTALFTRHHRLTSQNLSQTYGYDIIQDSNGTLVIAGKTGGYFNGLFYAYSPFLMQTDSLGTFIASKSYSLNTGAGFFSSVKEDSNGGYIAGGTMGNYYPLLIRTNSTMDKLWSYYYGNFSSPGASVSGIGRSVIQNDGGGYLLLGDNTSSSDARMYLIKTDNAGNSGCYQAIPPLQGNSGTIPHTDVQGTVFSIQGGTEFDPMSVGISSTISDSVLCGPTGMNEMQDNGFLTIYPNPASNYFTVTFKNPHSINGRLNIFNIHGAVAARDILLNGAQEITVDVSAFSPGIYVAEYTENGTVNSRARLIIVR
jgi:hypothetical protein